MCPGMQPELENKIWTFSVCSLQHNNLKFKNFQFEKLELEETAREPSGNPARETKPEPELFKEEKPHQSSRSSKRQEPAVDPDDDVIKTDVTSGFAWNPAEVVARMYNIETIEDDHDEEQGDDSNLVIY